MSPSSRPTTRCAVSRAVRRSRSSSPPLLGAVPTSSSSTSRPTTCVFVLAVAVLGRGLKLTLPLLPSRPQLDRESLAALISALKNYDGGVLVITQCVPEPFDPLVVVVVEQKLTLPLFLARSNQEFSESICTEVWAMKDGYLTASGHNWVEGQGAGPRIDQAKEGDEEDVFDAMGNKIVRSSSSFSFSSLSRCATDSPSLSPCRMRPRRSRRRPPRCVLVLLDLSSSPSLTLSTSQDARKAKKDRMARKKLGLPSDDEAECESRFPSRSAWKTPGPPPPRRVRATASQGSARLTLSIKADFPVMPAD